MEVLPVGCIHADRCRCIALNATSLACGAAGNLFLLFNFTRTVRYIIALPASILLWFVATGIVSDKPWNSFLNPV